MADPQVDPALAPLDPLNTTPPPLANGYGNSLLGVASEFFKLHAADNRRQANRELDRREQLAQQFDQFSNDQRYANHPELQREAHMHAAAIRQIPYDKKLPTQYKPDTEGLIPAYGNLFHRVAAAEIRKNGEPSKPPEPQQPAAPTNPFAQGPPPPQVGPFGPTDLAPAVSAPQQPQLQAGAVPGGMQPMPGRVSPAPATGGQSAMATPPPAPPAPPTSPQMEEIMPMTPPEMAAFNNSIPASSAPDLAEQMGIDLEANPHALIDLRALKSSAGMLSKSKDRELKMRLAGLDPETGERLPAEQQTPMAHYRTSMSDLAEARVELVHAQTISNPIERAAKLAHWKAQEAIAQQGISQGAERLGISKQRLALDQSLYGTMGAPGASGAPGTATAGSGGPSDYMGDNHVSQTNSGKYYVDLTGYTGKIKNAMMDRYTAQGLTVVDGPRAKALSDIDGARLNQDSVLANVLDKLPKDATGRITGGLGNKISQFLQSDEELAAFNAWRTTAIRTLRATAGSEGLRLNEKEILLAVANDIPKITDTIGTAQQKQANIRAQLDNVESSILVKRRGGMRGSAGKDDYSNAGINTPPPDPNAQPVARAGGNVLPPASQRVVGKTTANIGGQPMVWSQTKKGVGWAPAPQR